MPANLSFDSYFAGLMRKPDTPNWLGGLDKPARTSASSLLPGNSARTSSGVIPSLRPLMSGTPARVSWQVGFSCPVALLVCAGDWLELIFASDCEPADLDAVQATDNPITKNSEV